MPLWVITHQNIRSHIEGPTDGSGNVVYSAAHDPYGGIQKRWTNPPVYDPQLKFSGKERDQESGLDYFGARYYYAAHYRFLSTDPIANKADAVIDPQLWNLYALCRGNPITLIDPNGCDVIYKSAELRGFFESLSKSSKIIQATLALYEGEKSPDLIIQSGEPSPEFDGTEALGSFSANIGMDYGDNAAKVTASMSRQEQLDFGKPFLRGATLTLKKSLNLSIGDTKATKTAIHELGHADQAGSSLAQYYVQEAMYRDSRGKLLPHNERPLEIYANHYVNRILPSWRR